MPKLILLFLMSTLLLGCVKIENLAPELTAPLTKKKVITPFDMLQDSPTCLVAQPNYVTINTVDPIYFDYGIKGDLYLYSLQLYELDFMNNWSVTAPDYSGNGKFTITFGSSNMPETGIYLTDKNGHKGYDGDPNRYVSIKLRDWNGIAKPLEVKPNQKVLVMMNENRNEVRVKFCNAELDFGSGSTNSGSITAELYLTVD